jgi:hypothetical protein
MKSPLSKIVLATLMLAAGAVQADTWRPPTSTRQTRQAP